VPKVKKSARGKHRWIGFQLDVEEYSRRSCEDFFSIIFEGIPWKLFDFKNINGAYYGILKVPLEYYLNAKDLVNQQEFSSTITSSGKIKLVRQRMGLK
tara:strand:+ start:15569 stop:15862 length:294 start_codon:yes stop_codon:yes gene_type:complete